MLKKKVRYAFKTDYEEPVKKFYPKDIYLPSRGIGKKVTIRDTMGKFEYGRPLNHYKEILRVCTKCGNCRFVFRDWYKSCPSGEFKKFESYYLSGKNVLLWRLTRNDIWWSKKLVERLYHCSLCGNCQAQCQVPEIHQYALEWLEAAREMAVELGVGPMPRQQLYCLHMIKEFNPYIENHKGRLKWLKGLKREEIPKKAEIVYYVGCTASYRQMNVARATFQILKKLKQNFTILTDEHCCGSPAQRVGHQKIALDCARHNVEAMRKTGAKIILTSCAGCYRMLKQDYKRKYKLKLEAEVLHSSEFLNRLLERGDLKFGKKLGATLTYHDPCHIGRHAGIYEEPRNLLRNIEGLQLVEMNRNKQNAWCCGGGGGVKAAFPELAMYAAHERVKEAQESGAEAIVSSCPFCHRNLEDAIKKYDEKIKVYDLVELIDMTCVP